MHELSNIKYVHIQVKEANKSLPTLEVSGTSKFTGAQFKFSDILHEEIQRVVSYSHVYQ